MNQLNKITNDGEKRADKLNFSYLVMNVCLLCILPLLSMFAESSVENLPVSFALSVKWFIFWAAGIRLFTAGIKQASNPEYTATKIFRLMTNESYSIIRELGFANLSLGVMGILSLINDSWRMLAAISSSIFFGLAALQHSIKENVGRNELVAALYDGIVCIVLLLYLFFTLMF